MKDNNLPPKQKATKTKTANTPEILPQFCFRQLSDEELNLKNKKLQSQQKATVVRGEKSTFTSPKLSLTELSNVSGAYCTEHDLW